MNVRSLESRLAALLGRAEASPMVLRAFVERSVDALAHGLDVVEDWLDRRERSDGGDESRRQIIRDLRAEHPPAVFAQGLDLARFVLAALDAAEGSEHAVLAAVGADEDEGFLRRAAVEQHRDDARDAAAAACACRAIASACWRVAQQRQGEQPQAQPPRR